MRKPIRIEISDLFPYGGSLLIRGVLIDPHPHNGAKAGEYVTTSPVRSIDFERGIAHTLNSTYVFEPHAQA